MFVLTKYFLTKFVITELCYIFKEYCCNFSSSRECRNGCHATKPTLKIILDPLQDVVLDDMEHYENDLWLFQFQFKVNYSKQFVHSSLQKYLIIFPKITLKSKIYVLAIMPSERRLFEVYRKMIGMELTIAELCKCERNNEHENLEINNRNQIWTRRKNLTGVHLKVAYRPNHNYLYVENNVSSV